MDFQFLLGLIEVQNVIRADPSLLGQPSQILKRSQDVPFEGQLSISNPLQFLRFCDFGQL
jgi:hypothetical protein